MANEPVSEVDEEITELSPETKTYFEEAKKPPKKEVKQDPAKDEPKKEGVKKEEKAADPAAKKEEPKKEEKKADSPKDAPDVERENLKKAVDEERSRRKEIADQLKQEAAKREHMEARFNKFLELVQQGDEKKIPEFDKDPAANLDARERALSARQEALEKAIAERDQATNQEQRIQQFRQVVSSATQAFMKESPDYAEAYNYVRGIRTRELEAIGVPPEQAGQALHQWEMQLAHAALQLGKNPAAALYGQAQALGYKKAEAAAAADAGKQDEQKKLETIAKGQEASKSLNGGTPPADLSLERIMQMDEDEMAELVRGKGWNKAAKFFKQ